MASTHSTLNAADGESLAQTALAIIDASTKSKSIETQHATSSDATKLADFEEAIQATGYGYFNIVLMLIALPCCIASVYEASSTSYIIPSAECDLQLSLVAKGWLNAISYAGMITSAIPWGYMADILGRRKLLIYGLFLDSLCMIASAMSQNAWQLMLFKYLGGFIMCGPFAVLMSYVSEFHGIKYRASVMMIIGMSFSIATVTMPIIAWFVIPHQWVFTIGESFTIRSWQIFLMICALPSFVGSMGVLVLLPESPKFLMSQGRNAEALQVMRTIFRWNTGRPRTEFPIEKLVDELQLKGSQETFATMTKDAEGQFKSANLANGLAQMMPLIRKPMLGKLCLVLALQFALIGGLNTMRLWLPQLYTMVSNFELTESIVNFPYERNLCGMIAYSVNQSASNMQSIETDGTCEPAIIPSSMYLNTIYSGLTGIFGYVLAGVLQKYFGAKNILVVGLAIVGCSGVGLVWATNAWTTVVLSSIYVSLSSIGSTALLGVIVNMFPTSLRTMTISVAMMFGRMGALVGNISFPYLLSMGCMPPFFLEGAIVFLCSVMCTALPKTKKTALQ